MDILSFRRRQIVSNEETVGGREENVIVDLTIIIILCTAARSTGFTKYHVRRNLAAIIILSPAAWTGEK